MRERVRVFLEVSRVLFAGNVRCVARCTFTAMSLSESGACDVGIAPESYGDGSTSSASSEINEDKKATCSYSTIFGESKRK